MTFFKNDGRDTIVYSELFITIFDKWLEDPRAMDDLRRRTGKEVVRIIREKWEELKRGRV